MFSSAPVPGSAAESAGAWPPLTLVHLAGAVRAAGHECEVVDSLSLGYGVPELERVLQAKVPDVLCVTAPTAGFPAAMEACRRARALGCTTIVGGVHASFMYPEFLPGGFADFAVVGEGEETLPELLRCLEAGDDPARVAGVAFSLGGRVVRTAPRPRLAALDPLPKAWDLLDPSRYSWSGRPGRRLGAVASSRGCPRKCPGCTQSSQYEGTWRARSPGSVAYELASLRRDLGADVVAFYDHAPAADARRFAELVHRLVEVDLGLELLIWAAVPDILRDERDLARWRAAGVVHVGICRDPSEDRLAPPDADRALADGRRAVHALREAGISSETSFWLGFHDETPGTIQALVERARAWDPDVAHFPLLAPLPYTPSWRTHAPHVVTRDYRRYNHAEPVVKPREMSLEDVAAAAPACYRRFYAERFARERAHGRAAGPWRVHPPARALQERLLAGASEEERRVLSPLHPVPKA
ncbi:MAG TPA: radical SAM protein [Anaeromyxobacteraceae bacterium]|nr:radical SAM protein [Anaeromyxobacteraceae bacterium]